MTVLVHPFAAGSGAESAVVRATRARRIGALEAVQVRHVGRSVISLVSGADRELQRQAAMLRLALVSILLIACERSSENPFAVSGPSAPSPSLSSAEPTSTLPTTSAPGEGSQRASGSSRAVRLAEYKSKEHGVVAGVVPVGQTIRIYDFDIKLSQPELADAETRLPWIANVDERAAFRGKRALIVPFSTRNDAPVARTLAVGFVLHTPDGKTHTGGVYNERLAAKQRGRVAWFDLSRVAPDKWVDSVLVFDVDPAELAGAVLYVSRWISVRDRFGRSRSVVEQQVVADLAAAIEAPPIRAAK